MSSNVCFFFVRPVFYLLVQSVAKPLPPGRLFLVFLAHDEPLPFLVYATAPPFGINLLHKFPCPVACFFCDDSVSLLLPRDTALILGQSRRDDRGGRLTFVPFFFKRCGKLLLPLWYFGCLSFGFFYRRPLLFRCDCCRWASVAAHSSATSTIMCNLCQCGIIKSLSQSPCPFSFRKSLQLTFIHLPSLFPAIPRIGREQIIKVVERIVVGELSERLGAYFFQQLRKVGDIGIIPIVCRKRMKPCQLLPYRCCDAPRQPRAAEKRCKLFAVLYPIDNHGKRIIPVKTDDESRYMFARRL